MSALRFLVTGANSPLGGAVGKTMRRMNYRVDGTVRSRSSAFRSPIFDKIHILDLDEQNSIDQLVDYYDAIIHVAAASEGQFHEIMSVTGVGTARLIQRAIDLGIPRFVHVSSMSVYGPIIGGRVGPETPIRHTSSYGAAKWFAECSLNAANSKISGVSVRSPAIVGKSTHRHFLARILEQMRLQVPEISISNPDFQTNNLIHEDCLAEFLTDLSLIMDSKYHAVPVASSGQLPLVEVVNELANVSQYVGKILWSSEGHPFSIDVNEATQLGFRPMSTRETLNRWITDISKTLV